MEIQKQVESCRVDHIPSFIKHLRSHLPLLQYFDPKTWDNDIALVRLRRPLDLEEHAGLVNTICLPSRNMSFIGLQCSVTGWGRTKERE